MGRHVHIIRLLFLVMLACVYEGYNDAKSAPDVTPGRPAPTSSPLGAAQQEFSKGNWDSAISLYRRYLRTNPSDYQAWNQLAAAYYHSGQVKQSLSTLQRVQRNSPDKSLNYFYQGMCIAVLSGDKDAIKYWEYAAYWPDEFGARATFELGTSYYRMNDDAKAKQWLTIYTQKFPKGPDATVAKDLLKSLAESRRIDPVKGFERPDLELTIYKYHPWSLFKVPHFWQIQVSGYGEEDVGYQPQEDGTLIEKVNQDSSLLVNASIGIGPIRQKGATSFAGYTYKQNWLLQLETIQTWFSDGLSLESFPIRGDMMERTHQFFGDIRKQFSPSLFAGAYARIEFSKIGSSFFPSPDESSLKVVTPNRDTQLVIPWVGWAWSDTSRSMFSLYLKKELHNQSSEHSNKTYDITGGSGQPAISFTLSQAFDFPSRNLSLNFDLFQYEFIFNDYWLDYSRTGGLLGAEYAIFKGLGASATIGLYQDKYKLPQIRAGGCGATSSTDQSGEQARVQCRRTDSGQMIQVSVYYDRSPNLRFGINGLMVENRSNQKVYSDSKMAYSGGVTWSFPGTSRVLKMTSRFADAAFTKDTEE